MVKGKGKGSSLDIAPLMLTILDRGALQPLRDGWLSWPCWLTNSRWHIHIVVTHPASSLAQDRESSQAETSVLTTMLRCQTLGGN